jgi:23S rRNA pseudouridine1911/1915/1917 synthase
MEINVLYEDNHLIAVFKPAGVLVQKGKMDIHNDDTLYWQVKQFLKKRDQKAGRCIFGHVLHRFDRPAFGYCAVCKNFQRRGAAYLSSFGSGRSIKSIMRFVLGRPDPAKSSARLGASRCGKMRIQKNL